MSEDLNKILANAENIPNSAFDEVQADDLYNSISGAMNDEEVKADIDEPGAGESAGNGQQTAQSAPLNPAANAQAGSGVGLNELIGAGTAVKVVDTLFPLLLVLLLRTITGKKYARKEFELNASERKAMEQPTMAVLAEMKVNFSNPFVQFFTCAGVLYGTKAVELLALNEESTEEPKRKAKKETEKRGGGRHKKDCAWHDGDKCNCRG